MKKITSFFFVILTSLIVLNPHVYAQFILPPANLDEYDAYGSLLAMNEHLAVLAQNDNGHFTIITQPYTNQSTNCTLVYGTIQHAESSFTTFVYSVAIGIKQNAGYLVFAYLDENGNRDVFLTVVFLEPIATGCVQVIKRETANMTDLGMQEHALVGMDPYGTRAYAVGTEYIVCIDVRTGTVWKVNNKDIFNDGNSLRTLFFPKALVVTEDHRIFTVGQNFKNFQFLPYLFVFNLLSPSTGSLLSSTELSKFNFGVSSINMTRYSTMSISLLDEVALFIIGIPHLDELVFLSWDRTNASQPPGITRRHISIQNGILFGKSIALLNNNTFAVLAYALPTLPWSTSQIQVYSLHDGERNKHPLMVYPNNQQIVPSMNSASLPYSILTLVSWKSNLGFVLDAGAALLLPVSPPGHCSAQIDDNLSDMGVYTSVPCISGTARSTASFGPCFLCPSAKKNNGTSGIECEACVTNDSLLCLRGTPVEVLLDNVPSYSQAYPYPDSPDFTTFDDALLQNIFSFMNSSSHCLAISPLFWVSLAFGLILIILIIMGILNRFPKWKPHRTFVKKIFTHLDLVGEGEYWIGGLASFAILILVVFACRFSGSFVDLYPIESISQDDQIAVSCDPTLINAKFTSALQLLSTFKHEKEDPIFAMLDEQDITLTIRFVSTGFSCHNVVVQENMDRGQQVSLNNVNCSFVQDTSTLSVSTLLPQHLITMQFYLTGPHFIGGLHICLSGPSSEKNNGKYIVQELHFCQFLYTVNQTLAINPTVSIEMTKAVNRTVGITVNDDLTFSGVWLPTLAISTLSDELYFKENGEYMRYLSDQIALVMDITESEFYMKNTQEPIARHYEITLHTILIIIVFLELFGLAFLLFKLGVVPLVEFIKQRYFSEPNRILSSDEEQTELARFVQQHVDEAIKKWQTMKESTGNKNDASITTVL